MLQHQPLILLSGTLRRLKEGKLLFSKKQHLA